MASDASCACGPGSEPRKSVLDPPFGLPIPWSSTGLPSVISFAAEFQAPLLPVSKIPRAPSRLGQAITDGMLSRAAEIPTTITTGWFAGKEPGLPLIFSASSPSNGVLQTQVVVLMIDKGFNEWPFSTTSNQVIRGIRLLAPRLLKGT